LLPQILRGRIAASSQASENVADYYGIPSINFGVEIAIRVRAGTLVMTGANPPPASPGSPEVFSADGTHPFPQTGHVIYSDAFIRGFQAMEAMPAGRISRDKPPMDANVLDQPVVMPLSGLHTTGDWQRMQLDNPTGQMARSLPNVWASRTRGDSIEFTFTGNLFGIYGVKGPDAGNFTIQIDDDRPMTTTLYDSYSTYGRHRIRTWFSPLLPSTHHRVKIELVDAPVDKAAIVKESPSTIVDPKAFEGHYLYVGAILVNGRIDAAPPATGLSPTASSE
jgi:hypothetical protein